MLDIRKFAKKARDQKNRADTYSPRKLLTSKFEAKTFEAIWKDAFRKDAKSEL